MRKLIYLLLCSFSVHIAVAQTVLINEGFEGATYPPAGWSVQNYSASTNIWQQYSWDKNSGNYSTAVFPNLAPANIWLYSKAVNMQAGKYYELAYYIKLETSTLFKITLNNSPAFAGVFQNIRTSFPAPTGSFILIRDTIICETPGTFYIGFNNYSTATFSQSSLLDDITFTELGLPVCTTVTAGTINSSSASACSGAGFTISATGTTTNTEKIRYAWQKSSDGTNWTNLTNGYTLQKTLQVSQTSASYYRLTDTCLQTGNSAVSNVVQINMTPFLNCYCQPSTGSCADLRITNITLVNSTINNTTACSAGGYGNYTGAGSATVYRNHPIYVQHTVGNTFNIPYAIGIWVDLNQDGVFGTNEFSVNGPLTGTSGGSQFLIPASALTGETRMRVAVKFNNGNIPQITGAEACGTGTAAGEFEDYRIIITDPANCSGAVNAGSITAVTQICPNNNFTISSTGTTIHQSQMRYAWQKSTDNSNWSNITNTSYLINPLTITQDANTFYRLTDTCVASGQSAVSNSISVSTNNIFTCYCIPSSATCATYSIDSLSFNTIQNPSGCPANGYSNFTNISTSVNNGTVYSIFFRFKPTANTKYVQVWIDLNRNGQFETTERLYTGVTTGNTLPGVLTIPFNVVAGETGMRVMVQNSTISLGACTIVSGTGEAEDYKVILNTPFPVTNKFCHYVKSNATGTNNGSSWTNAFTSLSTAFAVARTADTIKVAKGTYIPGTSTTSVLAVKDSIIVLGGYPDTGNPTEADRNFRINKTILSGEIGAAVLTDNVRVIIQASAVKGFRIDGFIIESGYDPVPSTRGPVDIVNSTGVIQNCVIRNNYNGFNGAGFNIQNSTISLLNNFLENNSADGWDLTNAVLNITAKSNVSIINNVIAKNKSWHLINQHNSTVSLLHSTIFKNYGYSFVHDTSNLTVQNSIFFKNGNNYYLDTAEFKKDVYSSIQFDKNLAEVYNYTAPDYLGRSPQFMDTLNVAGPDANYFTADDGLRLRNPCSPALNTGNNSHAASVTTDITGNPRLRNGIVDLGAYEVQEAVGTQATVLYVNKTATGLNNGLSWQDAFTDLQSAFRLCSDTIKVARGNYPVSATDPTAYYQLSNNRVVMGGFPNTGNPTNADFNPVANPTFIDGTVNASEKSRALVVSINNDSTSRLIGFELINSAIPDFNYTSNAGTVRIAFSSSPVFSEVKFNCATALAYNLVLIKNASKPLFDRCKFYNAFNNQSSSYSEPRYIYIINGSNPRFFRSYIGRDTTSTVNGLDGANLYLINSSVRIDSCLFYKASHQAIYAINSNPRVQNSEFIKTKGRSITSYGSVIRVNKTVFLDTMLINNTQGGTLGHYANTDAEYINTAFYNSNSNHSGGVGLNENSTVSFNRSFFMNLSTEFAGAAFSNSNSQLTLKNCVINGFRVNPNNSTTTGSLIASGGTSALNIYNSTIIGSTTVLKAPIASSAGSTVKFYNSVIWKYGFNAQNVNAERDILTENNNNSSICDIRNSYLYKQENTTMTNSVVGVDPKLVDLSNPQGPDGLLFTSDDGFKPCNCSPVVNRGNNSLLPAETRDILSLPRVFNGTIDLGAYELQENPTTDKTFYVKAGAAAGGSGLSWGNAYNSLQKAVLNNCADTIKVAAGLYTPAISARDSAFNLYRGATLLGGYPNTGNPQDVDRHPTLHPTILSGDLGVLNDSLDNTYNIIRAHCPDTTLTIDGFIIERGNANQTNNNGGAGILSIGNKNLIINNCILRNHYGHIGGALYSFYSNITVNKTVFTDNNSIAWGGGFYILDYYTPVNNQIWAPVVKFRNSVVAYNKGSGGVVFGSGVGLNQNNIHFENTLFYKNEGQEGGGLRLYDNPYTRVINCAFIRNNVTFAVGGIGIRVVSPFNSSTLNTYVFNTIFKDQTVFNNPSTILNTDFNWQNGTSPQATIPFQNLDYSAFGNSQTGSGWGNIGSGNIGFLDENNPPGSDNTWMTADDGLQPVICAPSIDKGLNSYIQHLTMDLKDSARIQNNLVDMGPYETRSFRVRITASDTSICAGTNVTFTAQTENAGPAPVYQWRLNGVFTGTNSNTYSNASLNNGDIIQVRVQNTSCTVNDTTNSNIITMRVGTSLPAVATITASDTSICSGTSVSFTATVTGANPASVYQWKINGVNAGTNNAVFSSNTLADGDVVTVVAISNGPCISNTPVTSNSITIHVNPVLTPAVSISSSANPVCSGNVISFTASPVNGGAAPQYVWKVNGITAGNNLPVFQTASLVNNDVVQVVMTSSNACVNTPTATSNSITQIVNTTAQPSVTISAGALTCQGSAVTLTANPVNGGAAPAYQWQVNGVNAGTNSAVFTSTQLVENDVVEVIMTSNVSCASTPVISSAPYTVHFIPNTSASVSIVASAVNICTGTAVTFTATPVNGGSNPAFQWQVNGLNAGTNSPIFNSNTIANNDQVKVIMTSNAACVSPATVTSNIISMTVANTVVPAVSIVATATTICTGTAVTFTATPVNGGASPSYQWQVNGVNTGANSASFSSSSLANNDQVKVIMTSNAACASPATATSNIVTMVVNNTVVPAVSNTASATTICAGTNVTFTATPVNGGASPGYQWQVNGVNTGTNSASFASSTLTNNDQVRVIMTSSAACANPATATSNIITMTVNPVLVPSVTISTGATTICTGSPTTFTANPVNGGPSPSYQWQVNGVNTGTNSATFISSTLANNDQVRVIMTSNASCAAPTVVNSNTITMTVNGTVAPTVSITATANTICSGTSVTFTATPGNGGSNPAYQWQVNGTNTGSNSASFTSSTLANNDQVRVIMTSNSPCASPLTATSNLVSMTVNNTVTPTISITGNSNVNNGQNTVITATITNGGPSPTYQWQDSTSTHGWQNIPGATASAITYFPAQTADIIRCQLTSNATCANPTTVISNIIVFNVTVVTAINPGPGTDMGIRYFPNPVHSILYIDSLRLVDRWETAEIINMSGNRLNVVNIANKTRANINVQPLLPGHYLVVLRRKNGVAYLKFIKQ